MAIARNLAVFLTALHTGLSWGAAPIQVLNLPFGERLDRPIKDCGTKPPFSNDWCSISGPIRVGTKGKHLMLMPPPPNGPFAVPAWVKVEIVHVDIDEDGTIQRILVKTDGPSRQDEVIDSVSLKFGKPRIYEVEKQNAFGARSLVRQATWDTPQGRAHHNCFELNECVVEFIAPKFAAIRDAAVDRRPKAP